MIRLILLVLIVLIVPIDAREESTVEQPKIGNFALEPTQRPSPLFSIGQTLVNKGDMLVFSTFSAFTSPCSPSYTITAEFLYGIRDDLSLYMVLPDFIAQYDRFQQSHGFSDLYIQGEYALYQKGTEEKNSYITVLGAMTLPTGSDIKNPPTGFGSPTFLLGFTAFAQTPYWHYFISGAGFLPVHNCEIEFSKRVFYQWGFGRNLAWSADRYIILFFLEFDGIYTRPAKVAGIVDPNSGGNSLLIGPSIWYSTDRFFMQIGLSVPAVQTFRGFQDADRTQVLGSFSFGWTI